MYLRGYSWLVRWLGEFVSRFFCCTLNKCTLQSRYFHLRPQFSLCLSFYLGFSVFLNHYLFSLNFGTIVSFLFPVHFSLGICCSPLLPCRSFVFLLDQSLLSCRDG